MRHPWLGTSLAALAVAQVDLQVSGTAPQPPHYEPRVNFDARAVGALSSAAATLEELHLDLGGWGGCISSLLPLRAALPQLILTARRLHTLVLTGPDDVRVGKGLGRPRHGPCHLLP